MCPAEKQWQISLWQFTLSGLPYDHILGSLITTEFTKQGIFFLCYFWFPFIQIWFNNNLKQFTIHILWWMGRGVLFSILGWHRVYYLQDMTNMQSFSCPSRYQILPNSQRIHVKQIMLFSQNFHIHGSHTSQTKFKDFLRPK